MVQERKPLSRIAAWSIATMFCIVAQNRLCRPVVIGFPLGSQFDDES